MFISKWLSITVLVFGSGHLFAESYGTAFTYQGQLEYQGRVADGEFDFVFTLFDTELEGAEVTTPVELENVAVSQGRFTVELDFGTTLQAADAYWLEIRVRPGDLVADHALLAPRQYLYPSPRSVFTLRAATAAQSDVATDADALQGHPASDFALSVHSHENSAWQLSGNIGTTTGHFLGTVDNQALELRVNGYRALQLAPDPTSPNVVGGYAGNSATGASGASIAGGGRDLAVNQVTGDFGAVGGGAANTVSGYAATIGGGEGHDATDAYAVVGGGAQNTAGQHAVVGGGQDNLASGAHSSVSGGSTNEASAAFAAIGGGIANQASGNFAAVGGGSRNQAQAKYAAIAGGGPSDEANPTTTNNRVSDDYGAVGGGGGNQAGDGDGDPGSAPFTTVAGGSGNAASGSYATIGGGTANTASAYSATVGGGMQNAASDNYATVAGGTSGAASGQYATVGGGRSNSATQRSATVAGGEANVASGAFAAVPGGAQNTASGNFSLAAGQGATAAHAGSFVWSDSNTDAFSTTAEDQFLIRAAGGVGIGTDAPEGSLNVVGDTYFHGNAQVFGENDLQYIGYINSLDPGCVDSAMPVTGGGDDCLGTPTSISVLGRTVYVVSYSTNNLVAFDVNDPRNIQVAGKTTHGLTGPISVNVSGGHVYVASRDNGRLVIFESSDLLDPTGSVQLPGKPEDVFVSGSYAYLVGESDPAFLAVVDVSNPSGPRVRGFVPTGGRSVHVSGKQAFVAASNGLAVYDVFDPDAVVLVGSTSELASSPSSVYVSGNRAYVTMEGSNSLVVYDISDPASPTTLGSLLIGALDRPSSVVVHGDYAFVAAAGETFAAENNGVTVLDISDPANMVVLATNTEENQGAIAVAVSGKSVFVTSRCTSEDCSGTPGTGGYAHDDRFVVYEFNHLETPTLQTGNLQAGYLDVVDSASVANGLSVGGGLNAGQAYVGGDLGLSGDLRMLGSIGGDDDVVCIAPNELGDCITWTHPRLTFTNDISLSGHRVLGSTYDHCPEGQYLDDPDCCGVMDANGSPQCLPDVSYTSFIRAVAVDGDLVPACDAGECSEPKLERNLGHPELRWGNIWATNGVIQTSDVRRKKDIAEIPSGLAAIERLRPVTFAWKTGPDDERHYGLIAQEVAKVLPELVTGDPASEVPMAMNYGELVPILIRAIQEQQERIEMLEAQLHGDR